MDKGEMQAEVAEAKEIVDANCFWLTDNPKDHMRKLVQASGFDESELGMQH